jgi:hypothetical protein
MVKISAPITAEWVAAVERAARMLQRGYQATRVGEGVYQVRSASQADTVHTIRIRNLGQLDATCDCPHGRHEGARGQCWHKASALCQETRRVSRPPLSKEELDRRMARFART